MKKTFLEYLKENNLNCSDIENIKSINDTYNYVDENGGNKHVDAKFVSCGQSEDYNEIKYIWDKKLSPYIENNKITEKEALEALCLTCKELSNPRKREDFYSLLSKKLGV